MALRLTQTNWPLTGSGHEAPGVPAPPASPWLSMIAAARYCGYDVTDEAKAADAMRHLARRHEIPLYRRGRRLLINRQDLDRWLRRSRVA